MKNDRSDAGFIRLMSFGFKYGLPKANYYFDVSFAKNPARDDRWGMFATEDPHMKRYVLEQAPVARFVELVVPVITHVATLDGYQVVAFGCNSGRHRSPIIVDAVAARLKDAVRLTVVHRDRPEFEESLKPS